MLQIMKKIRSIFHGMVFALLILLSACWRESDEAREARQDAEVKEELKVAKEFMNKGDYIEAIEILEDLYEDFPNRVDVLENLAGAYYKGGDGALAGFYYDAITVGHPELHEYHVFAANAYKLSGDNKSAIDHYNHFLKAYPMDSGTWKELGDVYEKEGEEGRALQAYLYSAEIKKGNLSVEDCLPIARIFERENNLKDARDWYEKAIEVDGMNTEALKAIIVMEFEGKNFPKADGYLKVLESLDKAFVGGDSQLKGIQRKIATWKGKQDEQELELKRKRDEETKRIAAERESAAKLKREQELAESEALFTQAEQVAVKKIEPSVDTSNLLADAKKAKENGNFDAAIDKFSKLLAIDIKNAEAWHDLALCYKEKKDFLNGEMAASEAMRLDSKKIAYRVTYLNMVKGLGDKDRLVSEVEKAHEVFPKSPDITLALAQLYGGSPRTAASSRALYEDFLKMAPNHPKRDLVLKKLQSK